ncbi:MAG: hypothetical protein QOG80_2995 [Pseudonocardiales bacterium]|nr:hypothetical protein [Pseudonocardiales bacterium]
MLLLVVGHLTAALGVPLGLIGAAVACRLAGLPAAPVRRQDVWWTVIALLVALIWLLYNVRYAAQDVYVTRDPATYTITGQWLVHHSSLQIHAMPQIFGDPSGRVIASGSFAEVGKGVLNVQGVHLLPVFLGLSGSMFGTTGLLATNTMLTTLALVVFFGLARRVVGSRFALLAMLAFALSMPLIFVGRDAYAEPLTMLVLMGSLLFLQRAWLSRRARDWALAGLAAGVSTCVRVDSYGALIGVVTAATVYVALAKPAARREVLRHAAALALGAAVPLALGWLDLTQLSRQYYHSQHGNITHLAALLGLVTLLTPVAVWLMWQTRLRRWLASAQLARRAPQVMAVVIALVFVALATRPSWQTTHGPLRSDLENMQRRWGAAVDGTRTYNEQTLRWQALYFGWPTVVLAFAGYAVLITHFVRRRAYQLSGVLVMGLTMSALYLYNCEVAPDQPWAMRRYVPVVTPLMFIAAGAALRAAWRHRGVAVIALRPLVVALAIYAVVFPLGVSGPMRHVREESGQLAQLKAICTAVGKHGAIIEADPATIFGYGQTVRSFCNVAAIGLPRATPADLATAGAAVRAHGLVPYVLGQNPGETGGQPGHAFSVVTVQRWPNQINKAPEEADSQQYAIWLSVIAEDGTLQPVPPLRSGS